MDLFTTYIHDSELQAIAGSPLISIIHILLQHPPKPFAACWVFTSRSLATASNSRDSSASHAQVHSSHTPIQKWLGCPVCLPYNSSARTEYRTPLPAVLLFIAHRLVPLGTCLHSHCLEMVVIYLHISRSSQGNGSTRCNVLRSRRKVLSRVLVSTDGVRIDE
jgi:hypothetical protein